MKPLALQVWLTSLTLGCLVVGNSATAQIIPDNTLPVNSSVTQEGNTSKIEGGTVRGTNLFHSFREFSVLTGGEAFFNNAAEIRNILTRVTGNNLSNINGLIKANGTANLFLMNPNGIIFGSNARLDIGGSFLGTTANAIQFGKEGLFSATTPEAPSELLTVNPSALLFNQIAAAHIQNNSVANSGLDRSGTIAAKGLRVPDAQSLLLVGGNVSMNGGGLFAFGGRVELGGLAGAGTVGLNGDGSNLSLSFLDGVERSDVLLTNGAQVNVHAGGGGTIAINARNFELAGESSLSAGIATGLGSVNSKAGNIEVNAQEAVNLKDESLIANTVQPEATGKSGDISITTGLLSVTNGAQLSASTRGKGDAGNISIIARNTVSFDGTKDGILSLALSSVERGGEGRGGGISITTGSLSVTNGAQLSASTRGKGDAGNISIIARDTVSFDGRKDGFSSGAFSSVESGGEGKGGDISITTGSLSVTNGTQLFASTRGKGDAGKIGIIARDTVSFDGIRDGFSSAAFSSVESGGEGRGGDISITTGALSVTNGAQLFASTRGKGDAGKIGIIARDTVSFDGIRDGFPSAAFSSVESGGEGNGGGISITTGSLSVTNGARLSASTRGKGDAGNISIIARDTVSFDGTKDGIPSLASSNVESGGEGRGGDISITTGSLSVTNGAQLIASTRGKGDAGKIGIIARDTVSFDSRKDGFSSGAFSNVESGGEGKGGGISITAGSLSVTNGARLSASTFGKGDAGKIGINARDTVSFNGTKDRFSSAAFSSVESGGEGRGGDISITTGSLSVTNGAQLFASTRGKGDAGKIGIIARDTVSFDGTKDGFPSAALSSVERGGEGKGGDISITTNSLSVTNVAQLITSTRGKGDGGNISIIARDTVSFDGTKDGFPSLAFSSVESGGEGKGGDISITTGSLSLTNGAQLIANTDGKGDAGNISINARYTVSLDGRKDGIPSAAFSSVESEGVGNSGDISITTGSLSVTNGAGLVANTRGKGDAGKISIIARDTVSFDGRKDGSSSAATSSVATGGEGKGSDISITTGSLSVTNGAQLFANTRGKGDAGNISIIAQNTVFFDGIRNGFPSAAFSSVATGGEGNGGGISITTGSLSVTNGARLSASTFGKGDAGNISINAQYTVFFDAGDAFSSVESGGEGNGGDISITTGSLSLTNGAQLFVGTRGKGDAGNISIIARDTVSFDGRKDGIPSAAFSSVESGGEGKGGDISITTGLLSVANGAGLSASSNGQGTAGDIEVASRSIRLDNKAGIVATTASGNGGNIILRVRDLFLLRRNSRISTNAGTAQQGGDGGNITIDAPNGFIVTVPKEDSDITANAFKGQGGNIKITARDVFGILPREQQTPESDITASSGLGIAGTVQINTSNLDPSRGFVELPVNLVDPSRQIAQGCRSGGIASGQNRFTITGRGGLPASLNEIFPGEETLVELLELPDSKNSHEAASQNIPTSRRPPVSASSSHPQEIVEAQGWVVDADGAITLVAEVPKTIPHSPALTPASCQTSMQQ